MAYTTIDKPTDYFNTVLWTGNATDNRSITGVGFQPDWVWYKERSSTSWHNLQDVVRGASKQIHSNSTEAEATNTGTIKAFETDGFQIGTEADINENGQTYVAWNWLAGSTASSNTDGSITSSVSANTTAGFSIVSYTGTGSNATVGHGLGVAPSMIIFKNRSDTEGWKVYHKSLGATKNLNFNETGGSQTQSGAFNDTEPTSSVFSVGTFNSTNGSSDNMIAYCFTEKKAFSKIESYTGNGSTDGVYLHLGFSASFIMFKRTDSTGAWVMKDNKRDTYNVATKYLYANASDSESTSYNIDFTSSGVKLRGSDLQFNASGGSFIYMAFAESPFVTSTGIPTTAR